MSESSPMSLLAAHYNLGTHPVTGAGLGMSAAQLDTTLSGSVAEIVFDDIGASQVAVLLEGLANTDFERENLAALLANDNAPENWRVGEALAEHYLTETRDCDFPWPDGRDERKQGSSLPGADLVGFQRENGQIRFAFGEVKTSSEANYPPGAMHGRHGLKQQLEDLRDRRDLRDGLIRYLCYRATGASWKDEFRSAASAYLQDTCDVRIFGILIRDVSPDQGDLKTRVERLGQNCPQAVVIELFAIYLPAGSISTLSSKVTSSRRERGES